MVKKHVLRLHLTNVAGVGASQLLLSLLPAFDRSKSVHVSNIYLPDRGMGRAAPRNFAADELIEL